MTWILDGEPLVESDTYVTEYHDDGTVILHITQTYQEDEGEYSVEAKNTFGTVRTTAELLLSGEEYISSCEIMSYLFVIQCDWCCHSVEILCFVGVGVFMPY